MKKFWKAIKRLFGVGFEPNHPARFKQYVTRAGVCVVKQGGKWVNKRDSVWHLIKGKQITSFGVPDWTFKFRGQDVLGLCFWGKPMVVHLGSPDGYRYNERTALHEGGHVGLMQAGDFGHNPKYRACFQGWSDTGRRVPSLDLDGPDLIALVDYPDGSMDVCHVSFEEYAAIFNAPGEWAIA
jgi:hypothetical protein